MADDDGLLPGLTVVGLPTRNEAKTIGAVAQVADEGLSAVCRAGEGVIVLADNGSTDGTVERFLATPLRSRGDVVLSPGAGTGKGTNVLALAVRALELGAQRLILLDGDLRSARPDWIARLARATEGPQPRMALPVYRRNRYEATSTNQLVRPLLAAVYGAYLQQPIGGEFAFNRAFLEGAAEWPQPGSASLYGIDVWLTANALRHGLTPIEVPLGRKVHNSPFPKILHLPQQVLDALFHVIAQTGAVNPAQPTDHQMPAIDELAVRQDAELVARINRSVRRYLEAHRADIDLLFPSARDLRQAPWGLSVTADQWPQILADAVQALAAGELERSRDHLIALCVNRVMTYWTEIEGLDTAGVDALLHRQAGATASAVAARSIVFAAPPPAPGPFHPGRWRRFQGAPPG